MSEGARNLENYFINSKPEEGPEDEGFDRIQIPEKTVELIVNHSTGILNQNEGQKLLIPFSGGKDSVATAILALEAHKDDPDSVVLVHEEKTSSPEEKMMVDVFEKRYGVKVRRIQVGDTEDFGEFQPDDWEKVERQFESRHQAMEDFIESGEYVRVLSGNLTEDLLGLLTPTAYAEEDRVLQPITLLFASEVEQLLKQLDVPRELAIQRSYTSETKVPKEEVLGADYDLIDAVLWLKMHTANVSGIARELRVGEAWLKELLEKRVKNRREAIEPILKEAQEDPLSMGAISADLDESLAEYRWEGLRRKGVRLSDLSLDNKPNLTTFYEGL